jgi:hypothetical protein
MTAQTIKRAFNSTSNLIASAKEKNNSFAYGVKKFFYNLVTLGFGKSMETARDERRENEIVHVTVDVLKNLPQNHSDLDNQEFESKTLHTNFEKKYQIVQEKENLCLYTGKVSQSSFFGHDIFDKDENSRTVLTKFSKETDFSAFKNELEQVKKKYFADKLGSDIETRGKKSFHITNNTNGMEAVKLKAASLGIDINLTQRKGFVAYYTHARSNDGQKLEQRDDNTNFNGKIKSKLDNPILCRHYAYESLKGSIKDVLNKFLTKETIAQNQNLMEEEFDKEVIGKGKTKKVTQFSHTSVGKAVYNECNLHNSDNELKMIFASNNKENQQHAMSLRVIKNKNGTCTLYFFDPNKTRTLKTVYFSNLEAIKNLTISDLMDHDSAELYFSNAANNCTLIQYNVEVKNNSNEIKQQANNDWIKEEYIKYLQKSQRRRM